jgi:hypothetical protein
MLPSEGLLRCLMGRKTARQQTQCSEGTVSRACSRLLLLLLLPLPLLLLVLLRLLVLLLLRRL